MARRNIIIALLIFAAVALALAGRLFFTFNRGPLAGDEKTYVRCVDNILSGRGFVIPAFGLELRLYVGPAYPVFLIPLRLAFGGATFPRAVGLAQTFLGLGTAALIYLAARRLGGRGAGAAAAFTVLLHPYFAFYASRVLTETLALFFLAIFLTFYLDRTAGPLKLGSAGAALALAALGRPVFLYLGALAGICLLLRARGEPWRKRLAHAGALAGAFVVVLTPWTARNFALSGRVIPVTEISGRILYQGNRVLITEEEPPRPKTLIRGEEFRARVAPFANEPVAVELAFQDLLREKALRAISEHPKEFFLLSLRRFGHMFILRPTLAPGVRGRPSNEFVQAVVTTFSILLYAAAAVGFFTVPGRLPKFFLPFACLLNLSLHSLSISLLRYRLPTDLLLALVAGFGVVFIWEKARRRGRAEGGAD